MLDKTLANGVMDAALSTGGDFCELFMESTEKTSIAMVNGVVENALSGIDYGLGLRLIHGFNAIYAYTNDTSRENLLKMAKEAASAIQGNGGKNTVLPFEKSQVPNLHPIHIPPGNVHKKEKVQILRQASENAFNYDSQITQTRCGYGDVQQQVLIVNSHGLWAEDCRTRTRFRVEAVASSDTEKQSGYFAPGAHMGYEFFETIDPDQLGKESARIAVAMLNASFCEGGKMPVIIDNGFGGVLFHEACGHSLEATSVALKQSVFSDRLGDQIASPLVTAVDDGTIPNAWGSLNIDDEGTPTQKNILIENGILKSYMVDALNGKRMGMHSTGSARRESYRFAPTSRMTNTYIENGKHSLEDIIAATDLGLYARHMGGGSVEPATGTFNFSVLEGYMIRNGKIAEPVRGAALIGKGEDILMKIDMVGNNLLLAQGMCGSVSGSIAANVGQPALRISEITVGGRNN